MLGQFFYNMNRLGFLAAFLCIFVICICTTSAYPTSSELKTEINDYIKMLDQEKYNSYQPMDFYGGSTNKRQLKAFAEKSGGNNNAMNMMRAMIALRRYKR